ncbi:MAG: LapA family protein [Burkholderiaceae bacterium]
MTLRSILFFIVFGALALFTFVNWNVVNAPTTLSLLFSEVYAPPSIIMLGFIAVITILFLSFIVYLQMSGLLETRRHSKELQTQRQLADQAEASRFTELRGVVESEIAKLTARQIERESALLARIDGLEHQLRTTIEQQANSVSALVGEIADQTERGGVRRQP